MSEKLFLGPQDLIIEITLLAIFGGLVYILMWKYLEKGDRSKSLKTIEGSIEELQNVDDFEKGSTIIISKSFGGVFR